VAAVTTGQKLEFCRSQTPRLPPLRSSGAAAHLGALATRCRGVAPAPGFSWLARVAQEFEKLGEIFAANIIYSGAFAPKITKNGDLRGRGCH